MKWLRLYSEARTDAKLESLPDDEFRVWHRLLCFANEQPMRGTIAHFSPRLLAVEVARGDVALLHRTLTSLEELRIIEASEDAYHFIHWEQRQYNSDDVNARVAKHRERAKGEDVTLQKRYRNVGVTPSEAEAEAEAEADSTPKRESEPKAAAEGGASPAFEAHSTPTPGASAPADAACDDATFIHLCAEVAQAAHLTAATPEKIAHLLKQHHTLEHSRLIFEAEMAAEWIADPSRNRKKRTMSVSFLNNWLSKASEPPHLRVVNGHNGNTSGAAANGPSPMPRASPAEPERVFRDARTLKITPRPASLDNLPPPPPKQTQHHA